jgi:hypothetical protein
MKKHGMSRWLPFCLLLAAFALPIACAEDDVEALEAEEAAREDQEAAAKQTGDNLGMPEAVMAGKFFMEPAKEGESPKVLGRFVASGSTYLVKIAHEELRKPLAKYDGKEVRFQGKIRNKGKYFVVEQIIEAPPPAAFMRNPVGL